MYGAVAGRADVGMRTDDRDAAHMNPVLQTKDRRGRDDHRRETYIEYGHRFIPMVDKIDRR